MNKTLRIFAACCLVVALVETDARAAEGGYSNYVAGTYGDFGMALAPTETWTLRNDIYYYDASTTLWVGSGNLEVGTDFTFLMNLTTLLYKTDIEVFGAQFAAGVFVPIVNLDLDASLSVGGMSVNASDSASRRFHVDPIHAVLEQRKYPHVVRAIRHYANRRLRHR